MRRKLGVVVALALVVSGCGTRAATITYATLAGLSAAVAISVGSSGDCGDHSECDALGAAIAEAFYGTAAVGFGAAALVSAIVTPDPKPAPAPLPPMRLDAPPGLTDP